MKRRTTYRPKPVSLHVTIAAGATVGWLTLLGVGLFLVGLVFMTMWMVIVGTALVWLALGILAWITERVDEQ